MPAKRVEITVSEATFDRIESARGDVPRAAWIKRALESALSEGLSMREAVAHARPSASTRTPAKSRDDLAMERQRKLNEGR